MDYYDEEPAKSKKKPKVPVPDLDTWDYLMLTRVPADAPEWLDERSLAFWSGRQSVLDGHIFVHCPYVHSDDVVDWNEGCEVAEVEAAIQRVEKKKAA